MGIELRRNVWVLIRHMIDLLKDVDTAQYIRENQHPERHDDIMITIIIITIIHFIIRIIKS